MLVQDRYQKIIEILNKKNSVRVSYLMELFDVSIETVRRDLEHLEKEGYLKRVYGGAVLEKVNTNLGTFRDREYEYTEEKKEIASTAIKYISEGQSIAMDYGTTTLEVAKMLKDNFEKLTVLTNSLAIANELADRSKYNIILSGGILRGDELSLFGPLADENLRKFHIDTCFVSVSGVSLKEGLTDFVFEGIQLQRRLIDISERSIVLADSSKFDTVSLLQVCDITKADMIITDSKLRPNVLERYRGSGIDVVNG